jgi:putative PIN family toxin of toxin-antitoxin system
VILRAVYDTNVLVSATLKPGSVPATLVALAMEQRLQLYLSPPVFREYREVLLRPKFGFEARHIEAFLDDLRAAAVLVEPSMRITAASDEPDNRFLECAREAQADYLVTGNTRHFPTPVFEGTRILEPAPFARVLADVLLA